MWANLVQRNDCDASSQLSIHYQFLPDLLVLDDNVVQSSTGSNLQRGGFIEVLFFQLDELRDQAFDFTSVEVW